jgi:hypothetical protein
MITALAACWLFSVVFALAVLGAVLPRRPRVPAVFCVAMCGSLIAMTWR